MFRLQGKIAKVEYLGYMTKYDMELGKGLNAKMVSYDVLPQNLRTRGDRWSSSTIRKECWS